MVGVRRDIRTGGVGLLDGGWASCRPSDECGCEGTNDLNSAVTHIVLYDLSYLFQIQIPNYEGIVQLWPVVTLLVKF